MPKFDPGSEPETNRTGYPAPYAAAVAGRWNRRLAPALGLEDFGASHVRLEPGAMSSQRHWHEDVDELVVMIAGEAVLVEDGSRTVMRAGDIAAFPKASGNGHHLVNESDRDCVFLAIGRSGEGPAYYPDIDLVFRAGAYFRRDGSAY